MLARANNYLHFYRPWGSVLTTFIQGCLKNIGVANNYMYVFSCC